MIALSKFPVYSENGNEYAIDIFKIRNELVAVKIFIEAEGWIRRKKFKCVFNGGLFYGGVYDPKEWGYDFVRIAKDAIASYEENEAKVLADKNSEEKGIINFNEWNGK